MLAVLAGLLGPSYVSILPMETSTDPVSWLVNYGVAGIVLILVITGQLRTKAEVLGLQKALYDQGEVLKQKDAAMTALVQQITNQTVPAVGDLARLIDALGHPKDGGR